MFHFMSSNIVTKTTQAKQDQNPHQKSPYLKLNKDKLTEFLRSSSGKSNRILQAFVFLLFSSRGGKSNLSKFHKYGMNKGKAVW